MGTNSQLLSDDLCHVRCIHQERVERAKKTSLTENENIKLCQLFKAMGDTTRLRILRALEKEEMCVCDLAVFLGITESAVSHQLRLLRQLHLVVNRRDGAILYYRLDDDHVSQLVRIALDHIRE